MQSRLLQFSILPKSRIWGLALKYLRSLTRPCEPQTVHRLHFPKRLGVPSVGGDRLDSLAYFLIASAPRTCIPCRVTTYRNKLINSSHQPRSLPYLKPWDIGRERAQESRMSERLASKAYLVAISRAR